MGADLEVASPDEQHEAWRSLERLAAAVRVALSRPEGRSPIDVLNRVVFDDEGFAREVEDKDLAFVLLPSVLAARRGSCVGLGALYLALGDVLGIPMRGVVMPGHFFVRAWDRGRWRNVELLRRGEEMPDAWYRARWPVPGTASAYGRPLTDAEVIGVIAYDVGNEQRRRDRLEGARRSFERAVRDFPTLPEAQASLGAVLQLEGKLDGAAAAYLAAKRNCPALPGLDDNIRLLLEERSLR